MIPRTTPPALPLPPGSGESGDSGSPSSGGDDAGAGEGADDSWEPADPTAPGGDDGSDGRDDPGEHPSREGDGRDEADPGEEGHRVSEGESLSRIADEYDVSGGWTELYERNRDVVGSDPDLIRPGQDLDLTTGR